MAHFLDTYGQLPQLGFGLGFKDVYLDKIIAQQDEADYVCQIDWLELIPENYMGKGGYSAQILKTLVEQDFPMASHGVGLSLGSVDPLNTEYIDSLQQLFELVQPVWFSDHLSFSSVNGQYFNDLMPLPFTQEAVEVCVEKIKTIQQQLHVPFLIENISYYTHVPVPNAFTEAEFITQVVEKANCGLLLDVNNVFVNAFNHGYNALDFLQQLPLERVIEIHIAGHEQDGDLIIDTHAEPVCADVFELLKWVYPRCPNVKGVLLERDSNLPSFEVLIQELQHVKASAYQGFCYPVEAVYR